MTLPNSYESANGIKAEETGDVKNKGSENAIQTVQGSYSFTSPEGQFIEIKYTADENGFQAQGMSFSNFNFHLARAILNVEDDF